MTDWERVAKLRSKGASWEDVANDEKVGFHPPEGTDAGRALKALHYRRKSDTGASRHGASGSPQSNRTRFGGGMSRPRWAVAGVGVALFAVVILVLVFVLPSSGPPMPGMNRGPASTGTMVQFDYLSQQHTDACHWPGVNLGDETANVNWINGLPDGVYLQGACCSPMDFQPDYVTQTSGLQNYSSISVIPPDPYNVPGHAAKAMAANAGLALTPDQQTIYDNAMPMTTDKAPCCCQCWAYYAHEGLAKTLIVQNGYDSQQVAAVLVLEDCCGGPGAMSM